MTNSTASAQTTTPLRVVFLVQRAESWINVHGLWARMSRDERFRVDVRVVPYDDDPTLLLHKRSTCVTRLAAAGVEVRERATDAPAALGMNEFDVAIFNAPYDRERVAEFHFDQVARRVALTVYIPYGLVMGAGRRNRHYQYAQRTQRDAGLVIARSEMERAMYARYCPTGAKHVALTGLPRLDELYDMSHFDVDPVLREAVAGRYAVLWNAHFSFGLAFADGASYSTFDALAEDLFALAARRPDVALIWRPHPTLFRVLVDEGILTRDELDTFRAEVVATGIILDERADHRHAFAVSDMLMTDLGSFLVEYLAMDKPLVYLHSDDGEGLNEEGLALVDHIDVARSAADALALIDLFARGADPKHLLRQIARERFLPMLDGQASQRVADRILMTASDGGGEHEPRTPLLKRLFDGLDRLRDAKLHRGRHRPFPHRLIGMARLEVVEWIKRHPTILRLTQRRSGRR